MNTTTGIEVTSVTGQPTSNQSVVCDTAPPNPTAATTAVSAVAGSTNVSVTVQPGAIMNSTVRAIGVVSNSTVLNQGQITTSGVNAFGMSATGTGSTLTNQGTITTSGTTSWGIDARGANTIIVNTGTVSVSGGGSSGIRTNALGTSITNSGTITATSVGAAPNFPSGILFQAGSTGTFTNQGGGSVSSANGAGVRVASDGLVTVRNAGTITGGSGFAVRFDASNNTLILDTGSVLNGDALSAGTGNAVRLQGTGSEDSNFVGAAAGIGFESLVMEGSNWTLSGNATITGTTANAVSVNSGTLVLGGTVTNGAGGGSTIARGATLQLGNGGTTGTVTGNIVDNGTLAFNRSDNVNFGQAVSGTGSLVMRGIGVLTLTADNTYTGGTTIAAGTLQLGSQGTTGSIVGDVIDNGALAFNRSDTATFAGIISGTGNVSQVGTGTTILTGDSTYTGGTTISAGTLQLGNGGASGSIVGDVTDNGALVFNRSDISTFSGVISGTGAVSQIGTGATVLTADSTYTGGTSVAAGTLAIGAHPGAALSGAGPVNVAAAGTLGGYGSVTGAVTNNGTVAVANAVPAFAGSPNGDFTIGGGLTNTGLLQIGGTGVGNRLIVAGNYVGAAGAAGALNTFLGADGSPSDRIVLDGGTASGMTGLAFTNVGGPGAQTVQDGILVVEALNGAVTHTFALNNSVSAGGFEYFLFSGGISPGNEENWYLRNTIVAPPPAPVPVPPPTPAPAPNPLVPLPPGPLPTPVDVFPLPVPTVDPANPPLQPAPPTPGATPFIGPVIPLYSIEVPVASAIPSAERQAALAMLGTFHERRGGQDVLSPADDFSAAWGRVFGQSVDQEMEGTVSPAIDGSLWGIQAGLDILRGESDSGHRDIAGVFLGYSTLKADVTGFALGWNNLAVGDVDLSATSIGAYWTHIGQTGWYLDGVLMGSFYAGQGQSRRGVDVDAGGGGIALSLEGGYPLELSQTWKLEPQAQLIWQHQSLDDAASRFATVSFDTDDAVTGRIGARLEGEFQTSAGLMQPYLKVNLWHGFPGSDTVSFGVNPFNTDFGGTTLELGGGLIASVGKTVSLYATADYTFDVDGEKYRAFEGNVGLSMKW